jgi:hypothetical protein
MKKLRMSMLAVCVFAVPGAAVADMVTETFTFPTTTDFGTVSGSDLTLFNPALGTLTSATVDLNATSTWSGGAMDNPNGAQYLVFIGPMTAPVFTPSVSCSVIGPESCTATGTFAVPSGDLSSLIGPGTIPTSLEIFSFAEPSSGLSLVSTFAPESVTYTYTPAVPEPEMLPVLGGILVVGVLWRRRKAA